MAKVDEVLYSWGPGESRMALAAEGRVVEFHVLRANDALGAVWLGRVGKVNKSLGAAFVEIGLDQPGWLSGGDLPSEGNAVLVQATADAQGGKGVKLTTNIALNGPLLTFTPLREGVSISRKIPETERDRLNDIATRLLGAGEGLTFRTAAARSDEAALKAEMDRLRAQWQGIEAAARQARAPAQLFTPEPLARILADNPKVRRVVVDDAALFADLRNRYPDLVVQKRDDVFELYDAAEELERALDPVVRLPSGGSIVIESTTALTAIDVNSGGDKAILANMEAAAEVARQIRLRNIGGQIVVDFIPVGKRGNFTQPMEALRKILKNDPVTTHVLGVTPMGLVEVMRERRRPGLAESMLERPALRRTAETIALDALRRAVRQARRNIVAAPDVIAALRRLPKAMAEAEARLGEALVLRAEDKRGREDVAVE